MVLSVTERHNPKPVSTTQKPVSVDPQTGSLTLKPVCRCQNRFSMILKQVFANPKPAFYDPKLVFVDPKTGFLPTHN
jgi:hypothetical protein